MSWFRDWWLNKSSTERTPSPIDRYRPYSPSSSHRSSEYGTIIDASVRNGVHASVENVASNDPPKLQRVALEDGVHACGASRQDGGHSRQELQQQRSGRQPYTSPFWNREVDNDSDNNKQTPTQKQKEDEESFTDDMYDYCNERYHARDDDDSSNFTHFPNFDLSQMKQFPDDENDEDYNCGQISSKTGESMGQRGRPRQLTSVPASVNVSHEPAIKPRRSSKTPLHEKRTRRTRRSATTLSKVDNRNSSEMLPRLSRPMISVAQGIPISTFAKFDNDGNNLHSTNVERAFSQKPSSTSPHPPHPHYPPKRSPNNSPPYEHKTTASISLDGTNTVEDVDTNGNGSNRVVDGGGDWTSYHDDIIRRWKSQVFVYMQLQSNSCYFFRQVYNLMSYPVIILTIMSSATVFTSREDAVRYVVSAMSIISAILSTLIRQIRPAELSQQHGLYSHRYRIILHSLETCMKTPIHMRKDVAYFLDRIQSEINNLITSQLDPPGIVVRKYEAFFGPVEAILYGDDVISIAINNLKTRNFVDELYRRSKTEQPDMSKQTWKAIEKMLARTNGMDVAQAHMSPLAAAATLNNYDHEYDDEDEDDLEKQKRIPSKT